MADQKDRDWVDISSKLLLPVVIFAVGLYFTHKKDVSDEKNLQFEHQNEILKLASSSNPTEQLVGLKMIEVLQQQGSFPEYLNPVLDQIAAGRPSDPSTQKARSILAAEPQQKPAVQTQVPVTPKAQHPVVYLQIAREDQRAAASEIKGRLQSIGFSAPGIELVKQPTMNTYIRYFSVDDKPEADKVLQLMREMNFKVEEQNFTRLNQNNASSGQLEVWIGDKYVPPPPS
jgi:hypothetical protein